ncbi:MULTISPECIES: hypothetical protein [unclassified Bradyrhizobium]|uniref:hypothetical protein n=1 Tax=Bradyrhizobium sp. USDA 4541 TaxID=2817704 RepID=UPI0020A2BF86|nr:hypothetical protein [Bradyrhizobium sp. USDA 4541]MCP1854792.1 hypothetical protein [Bradyrhizobium sp. USDA 4541]
MAATVLDRVYNAKPIDWAGGQDLQKMNERRTAYIAPLKAADKDDINPLLEFVGVMNAPSNAVRGHEQESQLWLQPQNPKQRGKDAIRSSMALHPNGVDQESLRKSHFEVV